MVFRGLPRACWEFYGKRSLRYYSVTTPCARPTRVNTERLAERETLLHRLLVGSKLNRTVLNSCGNSLSVPQKHVTFPQPGFFGNRVIFTKLTIFGNTKRVIQDYDTVFDNSIPFRKNDPLRILQCSVPIEVGVLDVVGSGVLDVVGSGVLDVVCSGVLDVVGSGVLDVVCTGTMHKSPA